MGISFAYLEHIFGISWANIGHFLDISWVFIRHIFVHDFGISWAFLRTTFGHIFWISWAYLWHMLAIFVVSCRLVAKIVVIATPNTSSVSTFGIFLLKGGSPSPPRRDSRDSGFGLLYHDVHHLCHLAQRLLLLPGSGCLSNTS